MTSAKLRAGLLSALPALDETTLKDLEALASQAELIEVRRGGILVRRGEPSDVLYFVLSGRFSVHSDGVAEPIAEIAQGQPIGEIGFSGCREPRRCRRCATRACSRSRVSVSAS